MARGVSKDFINLLFDDALSSRGRVWAVAIIMGVLAGLAAWLWWPWGLAVHFLAIGLGCGLGWAVAARRVGGYEGSIRDEWNEWMRLAPACDTVADVGRKVRGGRAANRAYLLAAVLTLLWSIEVILAVVTFNTGGDPIMESVAIAANGVLAGALLGHQVRLMTWTKGFATSLAEMVRDGEIGVWGTR